MEQELTTSLKKVVKGTGIVFVGTVLGTLLSVISRILVVRYINKTEYGLLSLSFAIISILSTLSCLGFGNALPRYISYTLGQKDYRKTWAAIKTSISLVAFLSISFSAILFFFSVHIANFFHKPNLGFVIKIMSFLLPLMVLTNVIIYILRGFEDIKGKVYFQNIFSIIIKIILLILVIFLNFSFKGVLYAYLFSATLTLILLIFYARNLIRRSIPQPSVSTPFITKELLFFSLPLLGSAISIILGERSTTLLLGYFKPASVVGLYNVAFSLAQFISMPLMAMVFIYLPIASRLYAQGNLKDMKALYISVTKWTFFFTLPIFLCMLLAPQIIIRLLFGIKYIEASTALQILTLGLFIHIFLGPNGTTLISLGKTNILLFCSIISAFVGIIIAVLLIPNYGIIGGAISTTISFIINNFMISFFLFKFSVIHPFSKDYVKPIFITIIFSLIISQVIGSSFTTDWEKFVLIFLIFFIFIMAIFMTKSFNQEDIWLIKTIGKK